MIGKLISSTISGAVVGYVTNDLAIKMLFEKKFGLGGVILKTREQFIDNISSLVEREIINDRTLGKELSQSPEKFEQVLQRLTNYFFERELINAVPPGFKITDIPQVAPSFYAVQSHLTEVAHEFAPTLADFLLTHISVEDIISEKQVDFISQRFAELLPGMLQEAQAVREGAAELYGLLGEKRIVDLVPAQGWQQLAANLGSSTYPLHRTLKESFHEDIDQLIGSVMNSLQVETLIAELSASFAEKRLQDVLGREHTGNLSGELIRRLQDIINSKEGAEMVHTFSEFLLRTLEKEQTTIFGLLSADLARNFEQFLHKKLPVIITSLINWLHERRSQLEQLIDETFRENIDSRLKTWVLGLFVQSISQSADVVKKMVEILDRHRRNPAETSAAVTERVVDFLKRNTIGDIVTQIKGTNTGDKLAGLLQKGIQQGLANLRPEKVSHFFDRSIGEFIPAGEIQQFLSNALQKLIEQGLKERTIYQESFSILVEKTIREELQRLGNKPIGQLISEPLFSRFASAAPDYLADFARRQQPSISHYLHQLIYRQVQGKNGRAWLAPGQVAQVTPLIIEPIDRAVRQRFEVIQAHELQPYLQQLTAYQAQVPDYLKSMVVGNLPALIRGNVERVVKQRMRDMGTEQLRGIVQKFMGTELQPITILGAWLGAVAGAGLFGLTYVPGADNFAISTSLAAVAYGITGYGTNWLALKMIFRPRTEKRVFGWRVPFTPGVLAKNQSRFANNMGNFVSNHLLNADVLKASFDSQKANLHQYITEYFRKNEYELITRLLRENQPIIADKTVQFIVEGLFKNRERLEQALAGWIESRQDTHFSKFDSSGLEKMLSGYTDQPAFAETIGKAVVTAFQQASVSETTLDRMLPERLQAEMAVQAANAIDQRLGRLLADMNDPERVDHFIARFDRNFYTYSRLNLNHYLKDHQKEFLRSRMGRFLHDKLIDREIRQLVFDFIDEKLASELAPGRQIGTLFGGKLIALIGDNLDIIANKMITLGLDWLRMNKIELAEQLYRKALDENKAAFFYEKAITNTIYELADEGIPEFFEEERLSLKKLIADGVVQIGESRLEELDIRLDREYLKNLVNEFVSRPEMFTSIERLANMLLSEIFKVPLSVFLQVAGMSSIGDLQRVLHRELEIALRHVSLLGEQQRPELSRQASVLLERVFKEVLSQVRVQTLLRGINDEQYAEAASTMTGLLLQSEIFRKTREEFIGSFFTSLKKRELRELADVETLKADAVRALQKVLATEELTAFMTDHLSVLVNRLLERMPQHIGNETKDFLVQSFVKTALAALEANISEVVNAVDLKKVVVDELKAMKPEEIEKLFYSFADTYFTKLINYGFGFGIVFGLLTDLLLYGGMKAVSVISNQ